MVSPPEVEAGEVGVRFLTDNSLPPKQLKQAEMLEGELMQW